MTRFRRPSPAVAAAIESELTCALVLLAWLVVLGCVARVPGGGLFW